MLALREKLHDSLRSSQSYGDSQRHGDSIRGLSRAVQRSASLHDSLQTLSRRVLQTEAAQGTDLRDLLEAIHPEGATERTRGEVSQAGIKEN